MHDCVIVCAMILDPKEKVGFEFHTFSHPPEDLGLHCVHLATCCKGSDDDFERMIDTFEKYMKKQ
jgi:hypothetical protein